MIKQKIIQYKIILIAALLAILLGVGYYFIADPQVAVKIYKHIESGNLIYCKTGTLNDEFHTYEGEGKIGESKAEYC